MTERYIHIRNWDNHQRFKERRPVWVKLHTSLMRDDDYLALTGHRRAILHALWMEYALNMRKDAEDHFTITRGLREDTASLTRRLALRVLSTDLESLNRAGFIMILEHETLTRGERKGCLEVQRARSNRSSKEEPYLAKQGATVENSGDEPGEVTEGDQANEASPGNEEVPHERAASVPVSPPGSLSVTSLDDFKARAARVQARVERTRQVK